MSVGKNVILNIKTNVFFVWNLKIFMIDDLKGVLYYKWLVNFEKIWPAQCHNVKEIYKTRKR